MKPVHYDKIQENKIAIKPNRHISATFVLGRDLTSFYYSRNNLLKMCVQS